MKTKNIFKATAVAIMILTVAAFTNVANAQVLFSGGVEIAVPMSPEEFTDVASLGPGISIGAEFEATDNISVDAQVGFLYWLVKSDFSDFIDSYTSIPAQVGGRYYFTGTGEGLYGRVTVGIHNTSVSPAMGESESNTDLSYGVGIGAWVNEMIDIALRYNIVSASEDGVDDSGYIGVRAAYTFNR